MITKALKPLNPKTLGYELNYMLRALPIYELLNLIQTDTLGKKYAIYPNLSIPLSSVLEMLNQKGSCTMAELLAVIETSDGRFSMSYQGLNISNTAGFHNALEACARLPNEAPREHCAVNTHIYQVATCSCKTLYHGELGMRLALHASVM